MNTKITLSTSKPKLRGLHQNVILVYSTVVYTRKYIQLNYTKCASNNSTALYILELAFFRKG